MRKNAALALVCLTIAGLGGDVVSACGDKFLVIGPVARFRRAYAAIHPTSILIVLPPKGVKDAAVRDSQLQKALKDAGHRVEVVKDSANLADVLRRSPYGIVLAERAQASAVQTASAESGQPIPAIVAVVEDSSSADLAAARQQNYDVMNTPQPLPHLLSLLDDVMTARIDRSRHSAGSR